MKKVVVFVAFVLVGVFGMGTSTVDANGSKNLSIDEIKQKITVIAKTYDIPPEILKAIAFIETGYKQFNPDETPIESPDGGIGMMQITPNNIDLKETVDVDRLKTDIDYNIEIAAKVLNSKWNMSFLPHINDHDRKVLENWYFAVMAYNGLSKINDPNIYPDSAYQERVFDRIEGSSLIYWTEPHFEFPTFDIRYEDGSNTMKFASGKAYTTRTITPSQQMYEEGDIVFIDERDGSVSIRSEITGGAAKNKLWPYTPLTISGQAKESPSADNDFIYYKVKGITAEGYVASAYLNEGSESITFTDAGDDQRAAALAFIKVNGYANGYPDGSFRSSHSIKREHVAIILDNILNLTMPANYQMNADDVSSTNPYYDRLAEAEYNKLLGGGGKIRPKEFFTRAQMAQVMSRAFADYYDTPTTMHTFKDHASLWNPEKINTIYYNNVTVADPFNPNREITRSQFAIFVYRTMVNY